MNRLTVQSSDTQAVEGRNRDRVDSRSASRLAWACGFGNRRRRHDLATRALSCHAVSGRATPQVKLCAWRYLAVSNGHSERAVR
jgi:hypothetical protein